VQCDDSAEIGSVHDKEQGSENRPPRNAIQDCCLFINCSVLHDLICVIFLISELAIRPTRDYYCKFILISCSKEIRKYFFCIRIVIWNQLPSNTAFISTDSFKRAITIFNFAAQCDLCDYF